MEEKLLHKISTITDHPINKDIETIVELISKTNPEKYSVDYTGESLFFALLYNRKGVYVDYYLNEKAVGVISFEGKTMKFSWGGSMEQFEEKFNKCLEIK